MRKQVIGSVFHRPSRRPISFRPSQARCNRRGPQRSKDLGHQLKEGMDYFVLIAIATVLAISADPRLSNVAQGITHITKSYRYDSISELVDASNEAILHGER